MQDGADELAADSRKNRYYQTPFVVAVGASAGGLEAISALLSSSKPNGHLAFVIAQHMAPQHRSLLVELLAKSCEFRVVGATEGALIEPDTVYVNTPNSDILVCDGRINLRVPVTEHGAKPSIDKLFTSVAEALGNQSIGVVLSGTGSDGTQGCRAIRKAGGLTLVQNPETAKFDGMPNSAIRYQCADLILAPTEIAAYLVELSGGSAAPMSVEEIKEPVKSASSMSLILDRVLIATGVDFRQYKKATVDRQLQRRLLDLQIDSKAAYLKYIDANPEELDTLQRTLLISVTSFFRDAKAFVSLGIVIDNLIEQAAKTGAIRIWVPACATGEEAYSLAIMLAERLGPTLRGYSVRIFATDVDETSLELGRNGTYVSGSVVDLDERLLYNYFDKVGRHYRVKQWIRDLCVFTFQDLINDPPFVKMDLISCRYLLSYLNSELQSQLVESLHDALVPAGFLFLGQSEFLGPSGDKLFEVISKSNKIFRRKSALVSNAQESLFRGAE